MQFILLLWHMCYKIHTRYAKEPCKTESAKKYFEFKINHNCHHSYLRFCTSYLVERNDGRKLTLKHLFCAADELYVIALNEIEPFPVVVFLAGPSLISFQTN